MMSPKGIRSNSLMKYMTYYIASYRGGRNESFMYGYGKGK